MYRLMKNEGSSLCITHYRDCPDDEKPERPQLTPQIIFLLNQCFSRHTNPPSSTFPMSQLPVVTSTSMQQLNSSFQHEVMEEGEDFPNVSVPNNNLRKLFKFDNVHFSCLFFSLLDVGLVRGRQTMYQSGKLNLLMRCCKLISFPSLCFDRIQISST